MRVLWEKADCREPVIGDSELKQPLRILLVDDSRDNAITLSFLCRLWGFDSRSCFDGATALKLAESFLPNVFLLDVAMPVMSGDVLVQILRRLPAHQDSLFIALSGYADHQHRAHSTECGFGHYLAKPADLGELENLLRARESWLLDRALLAVSAN
jgi:CheY-like chemotaxis protein